jgi:hypothetical protein
LLHTGKIRSSVLLAAALAVALSGLGACARNRLQDGTTLTCPRTLFLAGTERATGFGNNPAAPAPENAVLEIELADLKAPCRFNNERAVTSIEFSILVERRNTAIAETYAVPFFVAVTDASGAILAKHDFVSRPRFDVNVGAVTVTERVEETLPLAAGQRAVAFEILVGLQVNEREYDYNLSQRRR